MTRKLVALTMVVMLAALFCGCNPATGTATNEPTSAATTAPTGGTSATAPAEDTYDVHGVGLSAPGVFPIVETAVTLTGLGMDANYAANFEDSEFFPWYEEITGVHIDWTTYPSATMAEQAVLLLASDEYPDIICGPGFGIAGEVKYGSQGYLVDLKPLIDTYGFYIYNVFEEYSDYLPGAITSVDGCIYALPNVNECFHCEMTAKAWINNEWLINLGLKTPKTTGELYDVLVAFRDGDANGNGDTTDEIPMLGWNGGSGHVQGWVLGSFLYYDETNLEVNDGVISFTSDDDAMREGLRYLATLFAEGLIDPTSLTMDINTWLTYIMTEPDPTVGIYFCLNHCLGYSDTADHRVVNISALAPVEGPGGVRYAAETALAFSNTALVLTDKCEYPEVAFRWADGLYDEEITLVSQLGTEGVVWRAAEEGELGIDGRQGIYVKLANEAATEEEKTAITQATFNSSMSNRLLAFRTNTMRMGEVVDYSDPLAQYSTSPFLQKASEEAMAPYLPSPSKRVPPLYMTEAESAEYARLKEQIESYVNESISAFMLGNLSLDTDWDTYVAQLQNLKVDTYVALIQTAYDRQYGN